MPRTTRRIAFAPLLALVAAVLTAGEAEVIDIPRDPDREQALVAELSELTGHGFQLHATDHFLIVYDTDTVFARTRGGLLERTHDAFFKVFKKSRPEITPLDRRLVCVLFREFDDYARYAEEKDGASMSWAGGYYSSGTNRIAFFHDRTSPRFDQADQAMEKIEASIRNASLEIDEARKEGDVKAMEEARRRLESLRKQQRWMNNRIGAVAAGGDDAKATHEAVHQLAFNTGLQKQGVAYPFWVTEGLAMSFEAERRDDRFGPYHDNPSRRKALVEAHLHGRLMKLDRFAAMTQAPEDTDHERAVDLYSQAWGLFQFLFRRHHDAFEGYMEMLAALPPGNRDEATMRKEFEGVFGPIPKLERQFNAQLRSWR